MKAIFIYTCMLCAILLQENLGARGICAPIFVAVAAFSITMTPLPAFASTCLLSALVSDLATCGETFSATMAAFPFMVSMVFFDAWRRKSKVAGAALALFASAPILVFHIFYFALALPARFSDLLRLLISLPLSIVLCVILHMAMGGLANALEIREPERMVFQ